MAAILFGLIIGTALSVAPTSMLLHRLRELRQRLAEALWAAEHDGLTGLPNRRAFDNHAGRALATNPPGSRLVLALIDLDRFKVINDTYGHGIGDLVLHATARRLHERVGPGGLIARLGGDEFVVLMPLAEHQTAEALGAWLGRASDVATCLDDVELYVDLSIGLAVAEGPADLAALMWWADVAMYRAKVGGLDVAVFDPEVDKDPGLTPGARPAVRLRDRATRAVAGVGQ